MGDNAPMTNRPTDADSRALDADLPELEAADPADAPQIAEDLADRLTKELDGSSPADTPGRRDPS